MAVSRGARGARDARTTRARGTRTDRRGTAARGSARPRTPGVNAGPTRARLDDDLSSSATDEHELDVDIDDDLTGGDLEDDADASGTRVPRRLISNRRRVPNPGHRRRSLVARWERLDAKRAIVLALVVSIVAITLAMPVRTYFSQRAEFEQLSAGSQQLQTEVADYQQKVNEQGDPAYIEAQARERLQFVRPGERAVVMMYPGDDARRAAEQREEARKHNPWYANLWESVATPPSAK